MKNRSALTAIILSLLIVVVVVMIFRNLTSTEDSQVARAERINSEWLDRKNESGELVYDVISPEERTWIGVRDDDLNYITLDSTLYGQGSVYLYGDEYYVADFRMQQVFRFSKEGKYINHIGEGFGEGPGEFDRFVDFIITDDGIFIPDASGMNVSWFTLEGELLETFRVKSNPHTIAFYDDSLAVFYTMRGRLQKYSKSGQEGSEFGNEIGDQGSPMDTNGYFATHEDKWLIYSSLNSSTLMIFDAKGALTRTIQTVDRQPFPKSKLENGVLRSPESPRYATDVAVDEGKIYVNTLVKGEPSYAIVDRYEFSSGEYIDSAKLPFVIDRIDVNNGLVVSSNSSDQGLIEFDYQSISAR